MARLRTAALALALMLGLSTTASAFDIGMMDAANSLPEGYIGSQYLAPRAAPEWVGSRPATTDQWNIPVAWSNDVRRDSAGRPLVISRSWARNLPTGTNEWNVPLEFITDPQR